MRALAEVRIPVDPWERYAKLRREAHRHALEADLHAQRTEKQIWEAIHQAVQRMSQERGR